MCFYRIRDTQHMSLCYTTECGTRLRYETATKWWFSLKHIYSNKHSSSFSWIISSPRYVTSKMYVVSSHRPSAVLLSVINTRQASHLSLHILRLILREPSGCRNSGRVTSFFHRCLSQSLSTSLFWALSLLGKLNVWVKRLVFNSNLFVSHSPEAVGFVDVSKL